MLKLMAAVLMMFIASQPAVGSSSLEDVQCTTSTPASGGGGGGGGDCRPDHQHFTREYCNEYAVGSIKLADCAHRYRDISEIWSIDRDIYEECDDIGRYSKGCEDSLPDDHQMKLNIDMVTHSEEEVNITVSWDHLHLNITAGSIIEVKLYEDCSNPYLFPPVRYLCTSSISQTSLVIAGAKFRESREVQLTILVNSHPSIIIKTPFINDSSNFRCTNTDLVPYDIRRCPPLKYGPVQDITHEVVPSAAGSRFNLSVTWSPPREDALFHAEHHYSISLTPLNGSAMNVVYFLLPSSESPGIIMNHLDSAFNYTIGIRTFVNCSGCADWESRIINAISTSINPSSTTSINPSSTTSINPSSTTSITPSPTSPLVLWYVFLIPTAMVTIVILLLGLLIMRVVFVRYHCTGSGLESQLPSSSPPLPAPPPPPPPLPSQPPPTLSTVIAGDGYISYSNDPHKEESPSEYSLAISSMEDEVQTDNSSYCTETETAMNYKVLVAYSPHAKQKDLILNKLVGGLNAIERIEPICLNLVSVRHVPYMWLQEVMPSVDAILCVWTHEFGGDWDGKEEEGDVTFVRTLRSYLMARHARGDTCNFATVLLDQGDCKLLPLILQDNRTFLIKNLDQIVAFITDMPTHVLS